MRIIRATCVVIARNRIPRRVVPERDLRAPVREPVASIDDHTVCGKLLQRGDAAQDQATRDLRGHRFERSHDEPHLALGGVQGGADVQ
eukprot:9491428-Pyramimonas_sp.AAC.1